MRTATLGIVLPVYNENNSIEFVFSEVERWALCRPDWHFLFVDDGSSDGTGDKILSLLKSHNSINIELICEPFNGGKGLAIRKGLNYMNEDKVCFTDGDLAYSLDHLELLENALTRYDMVIGNRNLIRQHDYISLRRRMFGIGFNRLARLILGLPYRDTQAGLKAFRAETKQAILSCQQLTGFGFDVEYICIARHRGFSIGEIPALVRDDHDFRTSKVRILKDSLRMFLELFRIRRNLARGLYDGPRFHAG